MKILFENWRRYLVEQERPGPGRTQSRYEKETSPPPIRMDGFGKATYYATGEQGRILQEEDTKASSKVVIIDDDKVLVLKRAKDSKFKPNHWDLPGGHLKQDESGEDAARRETKEETDIDITKLKKIGADGDITWYKTKNYDGVIKLDLDENSDWDWVSLEELKKRKHTPNIIKVIENALREPEEK
jgi:ADP-ribose pyrophosphatase YjhB (NUDIX family)